MVLFLGANSAAFGVFSTEVGFTHVTQEYQVDPAKCRPVVNEGRLLKSLFWDLLGNSFRRVLEKIRIICFCIPSII